MSAASQSLDELNQSLDAEFGGGGQLLDLLPFSEVLAAPQSDDPDAVHFKIFFGKILYAPLSSQTENEYDVFIYLIKPEKSSPARLEFLSYPPPDPELRHDTRNIGSRVHEKAAAFAGLTAKGHIENVAKYYFLRKMMELNTGATDETYPVRFGVNNVKALASACRQFAPKEEKLKNMNRRSISRPAGKCDHDDEDSSRQSSRALGASAIIEVNPITPTIKPGNRRSSKRPRIDDADKFEDDAHWERMSHFGQVPYPLPYRPSPYPQQPWLPTQGMHMADYTTHQPSFSHQATTYTKSHEGFYPANADLIKHPSNPRPPVAATPRHRYDQRSASLEELDAKEEELKDDLEKLDQCIDYLRMQKAEKELERANVQIEKARLRKAGER